MSLYNQQIRLACRHLHGQRGAALWVLLACLVSTSPATAQSLSLGDKIALGGYASLRVADLGTTLYATRVLGLRELNPIWRPLVPDHPNWFIVAHAGLTVISARSLARQKTPPWVRWTLVAAEGTLLVHNFRQMRR